MLVRDPFLTAELLAFVDTLPLLRPGRTAEARAAIAAAQALDPLSPDEKAAHDGHLALKALAAAFVRWDDSWQRLVTARANLDARRDQRRLRDEQ